MLVIPGQAATQTWPHSAGPAIGSLVAASASRMQFRVVLAPGERFEIRGLGHWVACLPCHAMPCPWKKKLGIRCPCSWLFTGEIHGICCVAVKSGYRNLYCCHGVVFPLLVPMSQRYISKSTLTPKLWAECTLTTETLRTGGTCAGITASIYISPRISPLSSILYHGPLQKKEHRHKARDSLASQRIIRLDSSFFSFLSFPCPYK